MASLNEKMYAAADHPTTRDELMDYFRATQGKNWKSKLADLVASTTGIKKASAMRRFQLRNGRLPNVNRAAAIEYKNIGAAFSIPPKKGFKVTGTLYIEYSECEECDNITFYLKGKDAEAFVRNPNIQGLVNAYNKKPYVQDRGVVQPCPEETGESIKIEAVY